jgi:hypothetical protein
VEILPSLGETDLFSKANPPTSTLPPCYPPLNQARFKNHSPGAKLLVEQLREFPAAGHNDGPDAAEMAFRLANEFLAARSFRDGLGARLPVG